MSEIHKFLFDGLPVRGVLVRLTDAWREVLSRRAANTTQGAYPEPLQNLLGEMTAAAVLMQSNIKFDGALVLQIFGDGPVKLAVVEVQPGYGLRATATLNGTLNDAATLSQMVNVGNEGRCAITLDPQNRQPGQQPYQGVVPLFGDQREKLEKFSDVLQHYMLQSEQLDTTLVLAANEQVACGLLIQRLPMQGAGNLDGGSAYAHEDEIGRNEDYKRIAMLASSLKREELLGLDADSILHRLFWDENVLRFAPLQGDNGPHFSCTCSRERVTRMLVSLGVEEAQSILLERPDIEVGCDFCGKQYRFDAVDVAQIFRQPDQLPPVPGAVH
ncbi:Hsp33 family molecular chaperone HslO [Rhodoferax antarcticus]|uniref:Hsp33 family protein n=1 Tax=Rhodoferax antarcticus ANT.BR TaxID=1111071 RepID=A0A1Q8YDX0_9BURK|nr:Hsp33 family molecular chaperone HslO [Rhodoferax antarcticus]APW46097.1 Hsp33 chaperonin [Rhodoferax antarcticus]MCW2310339.1 molecular chaperone Hsp33 [Rhodoferax antarcticus]OLP06258.1 hsp33 family protein [Rhodoferax antarcticus ANT.BR]